MRLEAARVMWLWGAWTWLWPWSKGGKVFQPKLSVASDPPPPTDASPPRFTNRSCREGKPGEHTIGKNPNWINPLVEEEWSGVWG